MEPNACASESDRAKSASSGFNEMFMVTAFMPSKIMRWQYMSRLAIDVCQMTSALPMNLVAADVRRLIPI